jgi:hypothetical protein
MFNYLSFSDVVNTKHLRCSLYREHFVIITLWYVIKCGSVCIWAAMFLLYHSEGCNICGGLFRKCYINDLHTTTCSGMLGHRTGRASGPSRSSGRRWRRIAMCSGKVIGFLGFSRRGVFIGEGAASEVDQGAHTTRGRGQP